MASDPNSQPYLPSSAFTCPDLLGRLDRLDRLEQAFATIDDSQFFSANRDAAAFQKLTATLTEKRLEYERILGAPSKTRSVGWSGG